MQVHLGILLKYHVLFIGVALHGMCNVSAMWLVLAQFKYDWLYRNENEHYQYRITVATFKNHKRIS